MGLPQVAAQPESGRLLEAAPPQVTSALGTLLAGGEQELIRVDTDLTDELRY